jgi:glycosyltransferase involved in cell wall biosynthesis
MIIKKLSVIVPAFNEEATIELLLNKLKSVTLINDITLELIIVDDYSTDNTKGIINDFKKRNPEMKVKLLLHEVNKGKGAALHSGIAEATGEFLIVQDADLEYDPEEFNDLLRPVVKGFADVVYGSRFMGNNPHRILFFWHTIGNRILTFFTNAVTNLNLTDMETCYKLFNTRIIQSIGLCEKRFGFEPEVTVKISRIKAIRIYEVGISYYGRTYEEGKKIGWKDGFRAIWCIIKYGLFKA